jgi:hypothetical protein
MIMANLQSFENVAIFTNELAYPVKNDPFLEVSNIIHSDGLISGDRIRISTYKIVDDFVTEDKILVLVSIP